MLVAWLIVLLLPSAAWCQGATPAGLWKSIDDATGEPRALICITDTDGSLQGRIEKLFVALGEDPDPKCVKCGGANHGAPS